MLGYIKELLEKNGIDCFAPIPLSACEINRAYLLERNGIPRDSGTVIMMAVPYYTDICDEKHNISRYAISRDYHIFFKALFDIILTSLRTKFPGKHFAAFSDHSPINEITAAAMSGIGIIGKNHLIITHKYSSYVFLGEIITDAELDCTAGEIRSCENCGACLRSCPMALVSGTGCISELTQRKGELTEEQNDIIYENASVWGCDKCQDCCPHSIRARKEKTVYTPIRFFYEKAIPYLTLEILQSMTDEEFAQRAYAWRGRPTIERNLREFERREKERLKKGGKTEC